MAPASVGDPPIMRGADGTDYVALRIPGVVAPLDEVAVEGQSLLSSVIAYVAKVEPEQNAEQA